MRLYSPVERPSGSSSSEGKEAKRTLLIVDDEEGSRYALLVMFRNDYKVLLAESGPKAIELVQMHSVDVVILDIRMAVLSGIEVLEHLKRMDSSIEVIMLTAYETLETAREALRLGACDYLSKPFDIDTMRESVSKAMARRSVSLAMRAQSEKLGQLQDEIGNQRMREEMARTRGDIYASIIHDINSPLTIISGFVQVVSQTLQRYDPLEGPRLQTVREQLERVAGQVNSCIQVCRRYLSFLRDNPSEPDPVDLQTSLRDLGNLLRVHSGARTNKLTIHPAPQNVSVHIHGTDLIQILLNLVINAFQCSENPHDVEVRTEVVAEPLDLGQFQDSGEEIFVNREGFDNRAPLAGLSVKDNGAGISPAIIHQIFTPYFTTKREGQGTGLGLAIVARLVERARGGIHVKTKAGQGTEFTVFLKASHR